MAFRGINAIQDYAKDTEEEKKTISSSSEIIGGQTTTTTTTTPTPNIKQNLVGFTAKLWKRVGLILIILFTILVALSINSLVQSLFTGFSPDKEQSSLVLLIISQFLYAMVVTVGLVAAVALVAQQEIKQNAAARK